MPPTWFEHWDLILTVLAALLGVTLLMVKLLVNWWIKQQDDRFDGINAKFDKMIDSNTKQILAIEDLIKSSNKNMLDSINTTNSCLQGIKDVLREHEGKISFLMGVHNSRRACEREDERG